MAVRMADRIVLKYSEYAIIPDEVVYGVERKDQSYRYELMTGETVTFEFVMSCNNSKGQCGNFMNRHCMDLYGLPFDKVERVWESRLGRLSGYWHKVKIKKDENIEKAFKKI